MKHPCPPRSQRRGSSRIVVDLFAAILFELPGYKRQIRYRVYTRARSSRAIFLITSQEGHSNGCNLPSLPSGNSIPRSLRPSLRSAPLTQPRCTLVRISWPPCERCASVSKRRTSRDDIFYTKASNRRLRVEQSRGTFGEIDETMKSPRPLRCPYTISTEATSRRQNLKIADLD